MDFSTFRTSQVLPTNPTAESEAKVAKSFHRCPVCQSIHYSKLEVRKHVRHDHKLVITKESFPELHYLRRDREPGPQNGGVQASSEWHNFAGRKL